MKEKNVSRLSAVIMGIVCLLIVIPVLYVISIAFTDEASIMENGYKLIPGKFSLNAFDYVLSSASSIIRAYGISIFVTVVGTAASLLLTTMLAYILIRKDFVLSAVFSKLILFAMLFNGGLVASYMVMTQVIKLQNTIFVLILPYLIIPWHVFLMKGFLQDTPMSIIESAHMDGAGEIKTFFSIVLPLAKPALATVGLFIAFTYWNDWWLSMLYIDTRLDLIPIQQLLYRIMNNMQFLSTQSQGVVVDISNLPMESARMAICILAAGPMMCVFPFFQKYFVKGLVLGSVKG